MLSGGTVSLEALSEEGVFSRVVASVAHLWAFGVTRHRGHTTNSLTAHPSDAARRNARGMGKTPCPVCSDLRGGGKKAGSPAPQRHLRHLRPAVEAPRRRALQEPAAGGAVLSTYCRRVASVRGRIHPRILTLPAGRVN